MLERVETLADVPAQVWNDRRFVVERFLSEERDGLYGLRTWTFFGDQETNSLSWSPDAKKPQCPTTCGFEAVSVLASGTAWGELCPTMTLRTIRG